jgi:hypothetical protein
VDGSGSYVQSAGSTVVDGTLQASIINILGGSLTGTGTVNGDTINNGGMVGPGSSAGVLTIDGDYTQGLDGALNIEVLGTAAGAFDQLIVTGSALFEPGTTINFSFLDGFLPEINDTFDFLLAAGGISFFSGDISSVVFNISGVAEGFEFLTDPTGGTLMLTALNDAQAVVPLPGAVWLFASGLLGLIGMARRKKAAQ